MGGKVQSLVCCTTDVSPRGMNHGRIHLLLVWLCLAECLWTKMSIWGERQGDEITNLLQAYSWIQERRQGIRSDSLRCTGRTCDRCLSVLHEEDVDIWKLYLAGSTLRAINNIADAITDKAVSSSFFVYWTFKRHSPRLNNTIEQKNTTI